MGYYRTGDYYRGDYYRRGRGDPGLFSWLGGALKSVAGAVAGALVPAPISSILRTVTGGTTGAGAPRVPQQGSGVRVQLPTIGPGGASMGGIQIGRFTAQPAVPAVGAPMMESKRRRRMNPANPRALRRAIRREHAFVNLARHVLKGTGITIGRHRFGAAKRKRR